MLRKIRKAFLGYLPAVIKTGILRGRPFFYNAAEIRPSSATLVVTEKCNLRCVMCKQWRSTSKKELSTDEWKRIIADLRGGGIKNAHFTGGEPLLRGDIADIVRYSDGLGITTGLTTNGMLLAGGTLGKLKDAGLRSIALSMDAVGKGYDRIRGVSGAFGRFEKAARELGDMKRKGLMDGYINFTLMKGNLPDLKEVKSFSDGLGLPVAICVLDKSSFLFELEENKDNFWIDTEEDFKKLDGALSFLKKEKRRLPASLLINFPAIDYIRDYFRDPRQGGVPCVSSQDRVIVDTDGTLLGGCMSMGGFGSLVDSSFAELSGAERYRTAKKNMFYKKCRGCSCGYVFNVRCVPGLIARDLIERIKG